MQPEKRKVSTVKLVMVAVAIVVIVILILQNRADVETEILFAKVTMPRAVLLIVTAAIGFVAGLLTATFRKRK